MWCLAGLLSSEGVDVDGWTPRRVSPRFIYSTGEVAKLERARPCTNEQRSQGFGYECPFSRYKEQVVLHVTPLSCFLYERTKNGVVAS